MGDTAIYLRKSRQDENSNSPEETIARHKELLYRRADELRLRIVDVYEEIVSGGSLYARPQMLKLLEAVEAGKYEYVLCIDIDRLGRGGMADQGVILDTFKNSGTKIITLRKVYDLSNEDDEEYTEFETFMARREYKMITKRMRRGTQKTIEEGGYVANAPYGYKKTRVNKTPTLEIFEEEAKIVRLMFELYVNERMGCQAIADAINAMGAKPHRADQFGRTSVLKIIRNPVYVGQIVWNQKKQIRRDAKGNKGKIIYMPREKWTITNGIHPAIVDRDLYDKAQMIHKSKYHTPYNTGEIKNPLAGIVRCASCGFMMSRREFKNGRYLKMICITRGCVPSSDFDDVESAVIAALKRKLQELIIEQRTSKKTDFSEPIASIEEKITATKKQRDKLSDFLEQGVYSTERFSERDQLLQDRITELIEQKNHLEKLKSKVSDTSTAIESITTALDKYAHEDAPAKNELLKSVIAEATYYKEKGAGKREFRIDLKLRDFSI